ncbi:4'-phosphopantetheinyl transferase family protein [Rickettsiales endosymbiont of Stachyamoeba lipophora]|uniref:4'-phosphopantetheinyl transferase family protein n=1 Tax=Rickettsiales endosymbiont of Stachyamoeba lipophora TaxID=2486578 RepID=UPI000F64EE79|nr:4'-phosphopantetheinyl transferase superfamily protein [Rickettsiales endosymbiont of Stachyamoeba lipophora]AZL16329.1 4'-phosphopantetheinyl transferase superfamily protein [Rickettsiales endosymbiont of Stachyamoeba lipophora]
MTLIIDNELNDFPIEEVWVYSLDVQNFKDNTKYLWDLLSKEEQEKASNFYKSFLTQNYIISHAVLRYILASHTNKIPTEIEYLHNKYGKPFLSDSNIKFNMSHSHNKVAYLVAENCNVGIDIEYHEDSLEILEIAKLVFTTQEYSTLSALPPKEQISFFYDVWVKKEALVKLYGKGVSYPLESIETTNLKNGDQIFLKSHDVEDNKGFYYSLLLSYDYSAALFTARQVTKINHIKLNSLDCLDKCFCF